MFTTLWMQFSLAALRSTRLRRSGSYLGMRAGTNPRHFEYFRTSADWCNACLLLRRTDT